MNNLYKKLRYLTKLMGVEDKEVFDAGGMDVTNSQLAAWRVGEGHKNYRRIESEYLEAYAEGLISIFKSKFC